MKRYLTFAGIAILLVLLSAPSFVKADIPDNRYVCGVGGINVEDGLVQLYSGENISSYGTVIQIVAHRISIGYSLAGLWAIEYSAGDSSSFVYDSQVAYLYIPSCTNPGTFGNVTVYNDYDAFMDSIPEEYIPQDEDSAWDAFYDMFENIYGFRPVSGSLIDWLRRIFDGDEENEDLIFPTYSPTPTPTPRPTPIPIQTIYVPDGNNSYTIIYQYELPDGSITQSPYNPNIDIDIDCSCGDGNHDYPNSNDPMYAPIGDFSWGTIDSNFTDTPAMSAGQSLDMIKAEVDSYDEPIKVVSNSFGALPGKWLGLVGLLGACLIVAGLIRTFLGG